MIKNYCIFYYLVLLMEYEDYLDEEFPSEDDLFEDEDENENSDNKSLI